VPAISDEFSAPNYVPTPVWYGFMAPANTPSAVIASLPSMIQNVMMAPEVKTRLVTLGAQAISVTNEKFAADIKDEYEKAGILAKKLGIAK
jgi:tripartite-type tricarboxylate transporter receptor subunit TctC